MTMIAQHERLLGEVLELPPIKRAEFIEILLLSFEFPSRQTLDKLWAKEVEERIDAYKRGEINAIPAKNVFAKIGR